MRFSKKDYYLKDRQLYRKSDNLLINISLNYYLYEENDEEIIYKQFELEEINEFN